MVSARWCLSLLLAFDSPFVRAGRADPSEGCTIDALHRLDRLPAARSYFSIAAPLVVFAQTQRIVKCNI